MKYSAFLLQQLVLNLDGTEAKRSKAGSNTETESFTVKDAFRVALNNVFYDEQPTQAKPEGNLTPETKVIRFEIMKKIWHCETDKEITLETKEVAELLKCVSKTYQTPEIYGFLHAVIEGEETGITPKAKEQIMQPE